MSKQVALAVTGRAGTGKGEARSLRRAGRVPAVAYGAALDAPIPVSVDGRDLYHALNTDAGENAILRLDIEGDAQLAIVREIQRHPVRREMMHVDFVTVSRDVKITVEIPLVLEGEAPGADEAGVVDQVLFALPVEVLPLEVPDQITVDISSLEIGEVIRVEDLTLPGGVESLEDPERTVVTCNVPSLEVPDTDVEPTEVLDEEADAAGVEEAAGTEAPAEEPPAE
jgi:large subunit ribosomal protein L25